MRRYDEPINTIGSWLKDRFGCKVIKLSLDGGFTCPNRDGSKGSGGCLFCSDSGSGEHASRLDLGREGDRYKSVEIPDSEPDHAVGSPDSYLDRAIDSQIELLSNKWPEARYIAYFQNNTNTYGPVTRLSKLFNAALSHHRISGLAVATRPDCVDDEVLDLLDELNKKNFLWVELGLQTIHEKSQKEMNLCYTLEDYDDAVSKLRSRGIKVVTHLILGLPGESRDMMLDSVRYVCHSGIFGIKLHMLNVVRDSALYSLYPGYTPFDTMEEYADLVIECLENVPEEITVHRIYAEAPKDTLVAPPWARQKRKVLNTIHRMIRQRNTRQGKRVSGNLL